MSTHNICLYGEISKSIPNNYHQIPFLSVPLMWESNENGDTSGSS